MTTTTGTRNQPASKLTTGSGGAPFWAPLLPVFFVLLWSTGFIGAKFGLPYAEPLTFLLVRLLLVAAVLLVIILLTRAPWPRSWPEVGRIAITGLLVHGIYLSGVFTAIYKGMPAGIAAVIVGLQPLLTAALSGPLLGERVRGAQWFGLVLGLAGVTMVLAPKLQFTGAGLDEIWLCLASLLGITFGTIYQKRHGGSVDLRTGTLIQYLASIPFLAVFAFAFETMEIQWTAEFVATLLWLVFGLSVGAIFLLFALIRRGAAASVASLFYLVPPVTAIEAWLLFGEELGWLAWVGMVLVAVGVVMANRLQR